MNLQQEKLLKKQRNQLKMLHNRLTMSFQLGSITTWKDLYTQMGSEYPSEDKPLLWHDLKEFLQKQKDELEKQYEDKQAPPAGRCKSESVAEANQTSIEETVRGRSGNGELTISSNIVCKSNNEQKASQESVGSLSVTLPRSEDDNNKHKVTVVQGKEILDSIRAKDITNNVKKESEEGLHNNSNYGLFESPNWTVFHYWFQKKAIKELLHLIVGLDPSKYANIDEYKAAYLDPLVIKKPKSGVLLLSPTGTGKTYIIAAVFRILRDIGYEENRTWSHIPYLLITKTTVIEQTGRVLKLNYKMEPVADVEVINIEMLRASKGKMWIDKREEVIQGDPVTVFKWKPNLNPCVAAFDESQGAKNVASIRNRGSTQGQIMCAYSDIKRNAQLICISATPFTRVCEAKCFAVSTHKDITYICGVRSPFPEGTKLSNDNWQTYAAIVSSPASPADYVQAAIERLMDDLKEYIVRVTGVKSQFKGRNSVKVISFPNEESKKRYQKAWDVFCERKAKIDALKGVEGAQTECVFAIITAFTMAAEKEHAPSWAMQCDKWNKEGYASVINCKFKGTIIEWFKELMKLGYTRNDISIIWGGGQTQLTEKQKNKELIKKKKEALEAMGMTAEEIIADMGLEDVEDRVIEDFPPEWRLGTQSKEDRQSEIDRFQSGITKFCAYTLKAGGVGLSLHQTDELVPSVYGRQAKAELKKLGEGITIENKELNTIGSLILEDNIEEATKKWNKYKGKLDPHIHSCLVRILRCRRKESGFVVEEDVPFNPVPPRKVKGTLSYNAIELVQAVGRVPRLTSQSDTIQEIDVYAGTYETEMGYVVSQKLRCLSSVVRCHEDWQDIIMGGNNADERALKVKQLLATTEGVADDTDETIVDESENEEE